MGRVFSPDTRVPQINQTLVKVADCCDGHVLDALEYLKNECTAMFWLDAGLLLSTHMFASTSHAITAQQLTSYSGRTHTEEIH